MVRQLFEESRYCNFYLLFNEIRYCNLYLLFEEIRYCNDHLLFEEIMCCNFHLLGTPKQLNLNMPDSEHSLMFSSSTLRTNSHCKSYTQNKTFYLFVCSSKYLRVGFPQIALITSR